MGSSCCKGSEKNKAASKIPPIESGSMDQKAADDAPVTETKAALDSDVKIPIQPPSSTPEMTESSKKPLKQVELAKSDRDSKITPKIPPIESRPMVHQTSGISHTTDLKTGTSSAIKIPIQTPPAEKKLEESAGVSTNKIPKKAVKPDSAHSWRENSEFHGHCCDPFYTSQEEYISADRKLSMTANMISRAQIKLAVDLYPHLDISKNIVFSPMTIALALALLEQGSSGKTGEEIRKLLGPINSDPSSSDKNLLTSIECGILYGDLQDTILQIAKEDGQLCVGNTVFCETDLAAAIRKYEDNVKGWFKIDPINKAPFKNDTEKARQQINGWVLEKTMGTISELYAPGGLSEKSAVVSVNSIYTKTVRVIPNDGNIYRYNGWESLYMTDGKFYPYGGMEEQKAKFDCGTVHSYLGKEDFHAIELPYKGYNVVMFVILPRRRDGIQELEKKINADFLMDVFASFQRFKKKSECDRLERRVEVYWKIPIFTIRFETSLLSALAKLGFQSRNELERMFDRQPVNFPGKWAPEISDIKHVACIKMVEKRPKYDGPKYEEGSPNYGFKQEPDWINFVADHPFLFVIVHKPTWSIMLVGKVNSVENE